ncbi:MAG: sigma-70 family RNA polymerase sigma factor [Myxococcales bacterium]|nr:sigma-70 family RNA polymerase sigma factor [Myxococcales bacterium]MDD9971937.1 sigma-70 family RNA polymerase sigma factor [Myxococcales bacterium]
MHSVHSVLPLSVRFCVWRLSRFRELSTLSGLLDIHMMVAEQPTLRLVTETHQTSQDCLDSDEALFRRFGPYVARIGHRLLGREADVDDLLQEVFLAAFKQRAQVRDPGAVKGWLATIAVRTARRQLRRRKLKAMVGLDDRAVALELEDPSLSPEGRALLSRVYEVLDTISVDQRLAWTLRHIEGEKLEDVADRCGCSLATAKRRIAAAHARIQAEFDHG